MTKFILISITERQISPKTVTCIDLHKSAFGIGKHYQSLLEHWKYWHSSSKFDKTDNLHFIYGQLKIGS